MAGSAAIVRNSDDASVAPHGVGGQDHRGGGIAALLVRVVLLIHVLPAGPVSTARIAQHLDLIEQVQRLSQVADHASSVIASSAVSAAVTQGSSLTHLTPSSGTT